MGICIGGDVVIELDNEMCIRDSLYKMYDASKELCFDSIETERIKELWKISNDTLQNPVSYTHLILHGIINQIITS